MLSWEAVTISPIAGGSRADVRLSGVGRGWIGQRRIGPAEYTGWGGCLDEAAIERRLGDEMVQGRPDSRLAHALDTATMLDLGTIVVITLFYRIDRSRSGAVLRICEDCGSVD